MPKCSGKKVSGNKDRTIFASCKRREDSCELALLSSGEFFVIKPELDIGEFYMVVDNDVPAKHYKIAIFDLSHYEVKPRIVIMEPWKIVYPVWIEKMNLQLRVH
jgi:hypothetical protein